MKILFNLLILKILSVFLFAFIIYELNKGNLDLPIKHAIEYYFQLKGFDTKVTNLEIINDKISIESLKISKNNITFKLDNIIIDHNLDIKLNYKKSKFFADISIAKIIGINQENQEFFSSNINFSYENFFLRRKSVASTNLDNLLYQDIFSSTQNQVILKNGKAIIDYRASKNKNHYDVEISFGNGSCGILHGYIGKEINLSGSIKKLPLILYKPIYYMHPKDDLMIWLNGFIKDGMIESSEFKIDLTEQDIQNNNYNKDNVNGFAKINNLKFIYHDDMPPLSQMQIDISQEGLTTIFKVNKANSTNILIENGLISMDWKGHDKTILLGTAQAHGPANGLIDLIPVRTQKSLQEGNIDLKKINGSADIDIKMDIPLKNEIENSYDIRANISGSSLALFNDQVRLEDAKMDAQFDGRTLKINSKGKINDFDSEIKFHQNFLDQKEFEHKLNITTSLVAGSSDKDKQGRKIGFVNLRAGSSKLDFEYISINNEGKISLNSDFKNLDLYFDKLGIHKNKGETADFVLNGTMKSPSSGNINFNLTGANNLHIKGSVNITNKGSDIILHNINHRETKISSKISTNKDLMDISVKGQALDLSNADMLQFLEKERESGATKMQVSVNKVRLKNDIWLDNLEMKIECNKVKCYSGKIDANIGSKTIKANLGEENELENWLIESGNAGATLRGIGAYNDMRAGTMSLVIKTIRKEVKPGEIVPIVNGKFEFNRFVLHNAPSLSKLVSVVSLPGFVGMIRGNEDIIFSKMNGEFTFQEGILKISESEATGPFFGFTMKGKIDTTTKTMELKGHVNPALYGASAVVGAIPIIGNLFKGNENHRGFVSAPYVIKESY
jgi:hypothetical protein